MKRQTGKQKNISDLRKLLPENLVRPNNLLSAFYFIVDVLFYVLVFWGIWHTENILLLVVLWLVAGVNILGLYQFGHDTSHGSMFGSPLVSRIIGQLAFLPCLHPVGQWIYGHNTVHHGKTVMLKGDLAWHPRSRDRYRKMPLLQRIFHRLYWSAFGAGFYYMIKMWLQGLIMNPVSFNNARRDIAIVLGYFFLLHAAVIYFAGTESGSWQTGLWFAAKTIWMPFLVANHLIGMTVYVQHINRDIIWKKPEDWDFYYGQVSGTMNYRLPAFLNFFIHNIFIHAPHHIQPALPFYHLPKAMDLLMKSEKKITYRKSIVADYLDSIRNCKLLDQGGKWTDYE